MPTPSFLTGHVRDSELDTIVEFVLKATERPSSVGVSWD